jgi:hypothetical protein
VQDLFSTGYLHPSGRWLIGPYAWVTWNGTDYAILNVLKDVKALVSKVRMTRHEYEKRKEQVQAKKKAKDA